MSWGDIFTRDELLDIRQNTPHNILPVFNYSDVLLDIVVGGAVALFKCFKKRKRGKRAGALVKLRQRGFRTVLPSIHLANLRSLPNKMDELLLLSRTNKDFSNSAALCFTESWLNDAIPDSALNLPGFQLFRADRVAESAGKSRGGGTCFYINERWCTDVTVLKKMCCPDLEAFFINCKPFYSPREFSSFILVSVYIPPQAHVSSALQHLADEITHTEQQHPDSVIIILGDFNKANLSHELPKFKQHISCPTRDKNILDHCYTTIKDAYRSVPRAALGLSDHCLVHLLPTYRPKLKSAKPVVRTVKRWTSETEQDLQACFECTDWSIFEAGATDLDELTETVTSYISFCEDMCIPTRTYLSFNNDKPWFTSKLRHLRQAKEDAFRNGDRVLYNQARNTLNKEIRVAKRSYAKKLENQFSANDPASVWKGLKYITNYKTPSPSTEANQQLAEDLNEFYCRFETAGLTPHAPSEHLSIQPLTPPATPLSPPPALRISEDDVRQIFLKQKKRKAPGPDGVTPVCLRTCADQLAFIFSQIFNRSLELCEVPACFKRSTIIPIPKKPKITGLNDYRPVALTSVVMKSFERLVLAYLKNITGPLLDPLQFAYRANSSAFNTIIPTLLQTKLTQLSVPSSICQWITSFLTDRHQLVKLGKFKSNSRTTSTGAPQGCVLSPLLFSLYTNDCTSTDPSIKLLKFADDTTVIGLIQDGDESAYRQEIEQLAAWCSRNNLELNTLKTVEMIVDFRRNTPALPPLTIMNSTVPTVASFRLYFLRQLRKFNLPQELLIHFYSAVIDSAYTSGQMTNCRDKEGKTLGEDPEVCMKKWKAIRDKFVRLKKRLKNRNGDSGPDEEKEPEYCMRLSWLNGFIKHRDTKNDFVSKSEAGEWRRNTVQHAPCSDDDDDDSACTEVSSVSQPVKKRKRGSKGEDIVDKISTLRQEMVNCTALVSQLSAITESRRSSDEFFTFAQAVADSLRKLPPERVEATKADTFIKRPGRLVVINGTMNSAVYQKILKENVRPSVCDLKLKRTWVLQQDNDPKHTSKSTSEWLKKNKMKTLEWPSQSPGLNPIEMLWHDLKKNTLPEMDPVEYSHQGAIIRAYEEQLATIQAANEQLLHPLPALPTAAAPTRTRCVRRGDHQVCLPSITAHRGVPDWASTIWDHDPLVKTSIAYFSSLIREVFEYPAGGRDVSVQLRQGVESAADHAVKFRTLAAQSGWNDPAILAVFREGLCPASQAEMACWDSNATLSNYITTTIASTMPRPPSRL
ncbi:hypothetical protein QTP86_006715 [Hemibagrus guttatus]|nr:hypothetical protein QTP86_006715 [Hemibagrus guttatus]